MNTPPDHDWQPDPQLLAAYFDGELDDRADLADLRTRLEAWLKCHPDAFAVQQESQALRNLWQETMPPEPGDEVWSQMLQRIDAARQPLPSAARGKRRFAVGAIAIGLALGFGLVLSLWQLIPSSGGDGVASVVTPEKHAPGEAEESEVLPVATASEVVILRVAGEDTDALVVGELPLHGPMELAEPGEIRFFQVQPASKDHVPQRVRLEGPNRPIIWARAETEED